MLDSHSSPEGLYNEFSHSAMAAAKDVRSFADLMDDGENKAVLERAKKRRSESEDGITTWRVTEHEDWLDHKDATLGAQDHDEAQDDDMIDTEDTNGQDKDPRVVTALFKEDYPEIIADMDETTKVIEVHHCSPPGHVRLLNSIGCPSSTRPNTFHYRNQAGSSGTDYLPDILQRILTSACRNASMHIN